MSPILGVKVFPASAFHVDLIGLVPRNRRRFRTSRRIPAGCGRSSAATHPLRLDCRRNSVGFQPDAHGVLAAALELHISHTSRAREMSFTGNVAERSTGKPGVARPHLTRQPN